MRRAASMVVAAALAAACGGGSIEPTSGAPATTAATAAPSTTTTLPPTELPAQAAARRLEWEGRVTVSTGPEGGRIEAEAAIDGAFSTPDSHRLDVSMRVLETEPGAGPVVREEQEWSVVVIGGVAWSSEDGYPYRVVDAEEVDYELELLSTALGAVVPEPELLAYLRDQPWDPDTAMGRPVMAFELRSVPHEVYAPLFGTGLVEDPLPGAEREDLSLLVDPATGLVLEAHLSLSGMEGDAPIEAAMSFAITAMDDDSGGVFPPGVEPFELPDGLLPFADAGGQFRIGYPSGWTVDDDGGLVTFRSGEGPEYASVVLRPLEPGATAGDFADEVLADASGVRLLERATVTSGGREWVRLDVEIEEDGGLLRAAAWLSVEGNTGIGIQLAAPAETWGSWSGVAASVFGSFGLLG